MKDGILTTHVNVYEKIMNGKFMLRNNPSTSITPIFNKDAKMYMDRSCQQRAHNAIFDQHSKKNIPKFYILSSTECVWESQIMCMVWKYYIGFL